MRYERLTDIVNLAIRLQGAQGGLTMDDIVAEFGVSRRTGERMRAAVEAAFGPLQAVDTDDRRFHWRLRSTSLRGLVRIAPDELAELESAARRLDRAGLAERAGTLRELAVKLLALRRQNDAKAFGEDIETLMQAEGSAMRPGPRPQIEHGLLALLRDAIRATRKVEFDYTARSSGKNSRQHVEPYGVLYGNRAYLVGHTDWAEGPRLWSLANLSQARMTTEVFERDPGFDLQQYAERSFGAYQEPPLGVVLRFTPEAARDAKSFLFHPTQELIGNKDGSLTVRFSAGGLEEMCRHLFTWGTGVVVEEPALLRERLQRMCANLAEHHAGPFETSTNQGMQST